MLIGRITKLTSAAVLGFGMMVGAASAATVIDFTGSPANLGATETYTQGGITLTVSGDGNNIHRNVNGLGVRGGADNHRLGSDDTVNESLTFSFSVQVSLLSGIVLEHGGGVEMFEILDADDNVLAVRRILGAGGSTAVTLPDLDLVGNSFTFRHLAGSGIRIDQLTVSTVPLPAAMPLMVFAFGGLSLLGRRRKTA